MTLPESKEVKDLADHNDSNFWSSPSKRAARIKIKAEATSPTRTQRKAEPQQVSPSEKRQSDGSTPSNVRIPVKDLNIKKSTHNMATQRRRADRGSARGNGQDSGEELQAWATAKDGIHKIVRLIERMEEGRQDIVNMEEAIAKKAPEKATVAELDALGALQRQQVKLAEEMQHIGRGGDDNVLQTLQVLKAMKEATENANAEPARRGASSRDGISRPAMELEGSSDSPAPSPVVDKSLRKDRLGGPGRSSLPPRDNSMKAAETPRAGSTSGVEINARGKIMFNMGVDVAFRPKAPPNGPDPNWIQGVVVKVIGEGKSRRYEVQDPEPDESTGKPGQIFKTSASSMVPIPGADAVLPDFAKGRTVLARYPETTTFYRAEIVAMDGKMVDLVFEDEVEPGTKKVDRRFVLDHRG